jgi:hypothetical protein
MSAPSKTVAELDITKWQFLDLKRFSKGVQFMLDKSRRLAAVLVMFERFSKNSTSTPSDLNEFNNGVFLAIGKKTIGLCPFAEINLTKLISAVSAPPKFGEWLNKAIVLEVLFKVIKYPVVSFKASKAQVNWIHSPRKNHITSCKSMCYLNFS